MQHSAIWLLTDSFPHPLPLLIPHNHPPPLFVARRMISATHGVARMQRVWGPGDGRPVPELKEAVDMLLQEYLLSRDLAESTRCSLKHQQPSPHHVCVYVSVSPCLSLSICLPVSPSLLFLTLCIPFALVTILYTKALPHNKFASRAVWEL